MENLELHYNRIMQMCFLLNGRDNKQAQSYSCGYSPYELEIKALFKPGFVRKVSFNSVSIIYDQLHISFTPANAKGNRSTSISINMRTGQFLNTESEQNAELVFGLGHTNVIDVLFYTEQALKGLLRDYVNQINNILTQVAWF